MARVEREQEAMEDRLEEVFGLARADAARPASGELLARIEADALAALPAPAAVAGPVSGPALAAAPRRAGFGGLLALIGGWPALGGLAAAAAAGLWLGIAPPAGIEAAGGWLGLPENDIALALPGDYFADNEFEGG